MACAAPTAARPSTHHHHHPYFSFHLKSIPSTFGAHPYFSSSLLLLHTSKPAVKKPPIPAAHFLPPIRLLSLNSVDVSKEDAPLSEGQDPPVSTTSPGTQVDPAPEEENKIDKRRLEERFAVLNTGIYECRSCGYRYDVGVGDPSYPIPPGLDFTKLPDDWRCPTCGAAQSFFVSKSVEIAGFAQNQQFGLGGNTLTSGQKALLIYGSLLFAFVLFLSGYFIQ